MYTEEMKKNTFNNAHWRNLITLQFQLFTYKQNLLPLNYQNVSISSKRSALISLLGSASKLFSMILLKNRPFRE